MIVYYLLTAVEPFTGKTPSVVALKQLRDPPPDIGQYRETLPKAWRTFVDRLMVKDRRARLGSADEVLAVLKALPEVE